MRLPAYGVIEGTGRTLIGPKGFRCQRAKIVALALGFSVSTQVNEGLTRGLPAEDRDRLIAEGRDRANAWLGVIQVRLGEMYPDAQTFATVNGMLAAFPAGEKYK
jgi:hypothetical protein